MRGVGVGLVASLLALGGAASAVAASPTVERVWGQTANGTAQALSQEAFGPGVADVYVATTSGFWDALSGGPAAARADGPMLLTDRDWLPTETRAELARLKPQRIVIQGGQFAVSTGVEDELRQYAPTVVRNAGNTMIDTAVMTSQRAFPDGARAVFVATSATFFDALSGGAAAAKKDAPILLVDPQAGVSDAVTDEIARLNPQTIYLLGGVNALPASVESRLAATGVKVERLWGNTDINTSLAINRAVLPDAREVYVVTNDSYYDGLAAAPAAAQRGGTVLLSNGRCLQPAVKEHALWLQPSRIAIVGGERAMAPALMSLTACGTTTEPAPTNPVLPPPGGFPNCQAAWDAGAAPLHRGDPGYRRELDRDGDGIACEVRPR